MNKLESKFAEWLEVERLDGKFVWWKYQPCKRRIADDDTCWYTPDFEALRADGRIVYYEVKGFWRDDARVKIKVAASEYWMYLFAAASWNKKTGWQFEKFGSWEGA
jgi:hypothetical protein